MTEFKFGSITEVNAEILQVPELELELDTERDSVRVTERVGAGVQFESEAKQTGRSSQGVNTLLKLKNANSQDLIIAVQDM